MAAIFKPHKDAEARRRSASHLVKLLLQHDPEILPAHRAEAMSLLGTARRSWQKIILFGHLERWGFLNV
jgi:hypothetical protein